MLALNARAKMGSSRERQVSADKLRLNLDHRPIESLRLSFSGFHNRSNRNELYGDTFFDLINQAPDVDLRTPDPDGTPYLYQGDPNEGREENPLYVLATEESVRKRARTQGSLEGRFAPLTWANVDANISYDRSDRRNNFFLDAGKKTEVTGGISQGEISQFSGTTDAINASAASTYRRTGPLTVRVEHFADHGARNQPDDDRGRNSVRGAGVRSLEMHSSVRCPRCSRKPIQQLRRDCRC